MSLTRQMCGEELAELLKDSIAGRVSVAVVDLLERRGRESQPRRLVGASREAVAQAAVASEVRSSVTFAFASAFSASCCSNSPSRRCGIDRDGDSHQDGCRYHVTAPICIATEGGCAESIRKDVGEYGEGRGEQRGARRKPAPIQTKTMTNQIPERSPATSRGRVLSATSVSATTTGRGRDTGETIRRKSPADTPIRRFADRD